MKPLMRSTQTPRTQEAKAPKLGVPLVCVSVKEQTREQEAAWTPERPVAAQSKERVCSWRELEGSLDVQLDAPGRYDGTR